MDPKSRGCLWCQAPSFACCYRLFQELRLHFPCTRKAAICEVLLVSGNSKIRAAPQGRVSWGQRMRTTQARTTQAVSLPTKAQSKASSQKTREGTDNKIFWTVPDKAK